MSNSTASNFKHNGLKRLLKAVLGLILFMLLLKYIASFWLHYQHTRIEQLLSQASGLQTTIKGPIRLNIFTNPGISLNDVEMKRQDSLVLTVETANIGFEILPLLQQDLVLHSIVLQKLKLILSTDVNGRLLLPLPATGNSSASLQMQYPNLIETEDSEVIVYNQKGETLYKLQNLNLTLLPYFVKKPNEQAGGKSLAFNADVNFRTGQYKNIQIGPTQLSLNYRSQRITADILEANIWDGKLKGSVSWSQTANKPKLQLQLNFADFDASRSFTLFQPVSLVQGKLNLDADLNSEGNNLGEMMLNLGGTVTLKGMDLQLTTTDIDELITQAIKTQQFNLTDVAAYFFVGPLGVTVTKGYDVANVTRDLKKNNLNTNKIVRIITRWNIQQGIAIADDVAMETNKYRLALKGRVNLVKRRFENLSIAVLDKRGCAVIEQKIDGAISAPKVGKLNFLLSPAKPIFKIIEKSTNLILSGTTCVPFYTGSLLPPTEIKMNHPNAQDFGD